MVAGPLIPSGNGVRMEPSRRIISLLFEGAPDAVWEALADTARFNEAAGLPRHQIRELPGPDGSITFIGSARMGPLRLEWEDLPSNWVRGHWFEHRRAFRSGPFRTFYARCQLHPEGGGCRGEYTLEVEPRGLPGSLLAGGFLASGERVVRRLAAEADRFALGGRPVAFTPPPPALRPAARERLTRLAQELDRSAYGHELGELLARYLIEAGEIDAQRIRPLELARRWVIPERHVIEACLEATRLGLLELRWDLLCPRCRGAKASTGSLDRLPEGAHCGTCNIAYGRDFSRNVELTFRPAAAIRPLGDGEFCLLGPMSTPHIWAHVTLAPGEERLIELELPPSFYRLRTLEAGPEADIEHGSGPFPTVSLTAEGITAGEPSPPGRVRLRNAFSHQRTVVIEERAWVRNALTADRVATLQAFRDLFSAEVLRPGDEVAIRRVTLLFSDLKGSTALYDAIGDAAAYRLVREHFAYLAGIVREHDGAIVKTIGDAVMAAFHDPLQALTAAIAMQERIAAFNATARAPIVLKLGLHEGPCIAVTLNERLDYFGGTVNLAARLQGESRGGDVVLSRTLATTPGAERLLAAHAPVEETARLRGFAEPAAFVRLRFGAVAGGG
ncbi:adenylate/guanylate cyclase domain-containing protein [Benzoatithermus flavus]|uniref:Adenylate/guanylate cyclase domain-containing protein n=1 Tax=Benzoatithermus flavus TaxID=3108223 RepID=A0ABU8XKY2_9PROT